MKGGLLMLLRNEKGMTLIEVLAAFIIIAIILVSFATFFTQNAKSASYNNGKLVVTNLADAVLAKVQNLTFTKTTNHINADKNNQTYDLQSYFIDKTTPPLAPEDRQPPTAIKMNGKTYTVTYLARQSNVKQQATGYSEKDLNLINIVVTVISPDGKTKSSTEGYVYLE